MVPVPRPDGTTRLCVDYRKLNNLIPQIQCPMRDLDEILSQVGGSMILSKLDLKSGFHQIPVAKSSRDYTTFISPWVEDHLDHIRRTLTALKEAGLKVKPQKCQWEKKRLLYLGHYIGDGKVAVPRHRVTAMEEYKQPVTKNDLQHFMGTVNYYRRFVPGYCNYSAKLSPATKPRAPGKVQWTGEMLEAFDSLRCSLSKVCCQTVPLASDEFLLHTDASGLGVGCVLNVCRNGEVLPAAFYSRQLRGAEQ